MSADTTPAHIGADAVREALKWAAAALQAIAPDEDTVRDKATGETRSVGQILDAADAALAGAAQPSNGPTRLGEPAPAGYVMAPAEPTDKMVQAAHHLDLSYMPGHEGADRAAIYRAMLASAPRAAPARWYMINAVGMATLCADRQDAEQTAADAQAAWPHAGPHRAVQMVDVAAAPAPAAQEDALDQASREELSIGKAINRAARDLPEGWEISIDLERGAGAVFLIDPDGNETMSEGGELFSDQINAAIDAAKGESNG